MKKAIVAFTGIAGLALLALTTTTFAAEKGKEVTITGEGKCAKCMLKETEKCQTVIQAEEGGKTVNYYLAKNEVSDAFHEDVCKAAKKVTAIGTVTEVGGKKELLVTKIDVVK